MNGPMFIFAATLAVQSTTQSAPSAASATSTPPPSSAASANAPRAIAESSSSAKQTPETKETPEAIYNAGVARFREGDFEGASELFARAATASRAETAARSMYNRGTSRYADVVKALQAGASESQGNSTVPMPNPGGPVDANGSSPAASKVPMEELIGSLEATLRDFKDAMRADPSNIDARVNAELAHRLLKQLKQQEQQEQQQNQQQDQQQNQQQDQQDQQDQQQQQQNQQQDQQDQQQQNQQQQQQDQKQDQQQQQDQQPQNQQQPNPQSSAEAERKPMTKQEVERLLQKIRDRERQRLFDRLARERARTQPAPKDW